MQLTTNFLDSNHTTPKTTATEYARALSGSEVSITAVVGPKTVPALPKQQPPIVSMFPVPQASKPLVSQASKPPVPQAPMVPQPPVRQAAKNAALSQAVKPLVTQASKPPTPRGPPVLQPEVQRKGNFIKYFGDFGKK